MTDTELDTDTESRARITLDPELTEALASDADLSDHVVDKILDKISRPANEPMPLGARTPWVVAQQLQAVQPEGHERYGQECQTAWQTYLEVARAWVAARDLVDAIPAEQQDERADNAVILRQQARDRKPLKAPKPKDWETERATRTAVQDVAYEQGQAAWASYLVSVEANAPRWVAEAVAAIQPAHKEAVKALSALAGIEKWLRVHDAAVELALAADPSLLDFAVMAKDDAAVLRAGRAALPALRALLSSEHPVISGQFITQSPVDPIQPPMHVRSYFNEITNLGRMLGQIELNEGWKVSRLAYDWRQRLTPGEPVQWRRSRRG